MPFLLWCIAYLLPFVGALLVVRKQQSLVVSIVTAHLFVLLSIVLLYIVGARVPWQSSMYSFSFMGVSLLTALFLLRAYGLVYVFSSVIQQYCLLLSYLLLTSVTGSWVAMTLTALVFAVAHLINHSGWWWKVPLTFLWGILSCLFYLWLQDPLINIAIHAISGAVLISRGLLLEGLKLNMPVLKHLRPLRK